MSGSPGMLLIVDVEHLNMIQKKVFGKANPNYGNFFVSFSTCAMHLSVVLIVQRCLTQDWVNPTNLLLQLNSLYKYRALPVSPTCRASLVSKEQKIADIIVDNVMLSHCQFISTKPAVAYNNNASSILRFHCRG